MKVDLFVRLTARIKIIRSDFARLGIQSVTSDGKEQDDSRMYGGTSGVLYAIYKYYLLLRQMKEATKDDKAMKTARLSENTPKIQEDLTA